MSLYALCESEAFVLGDGAMGTMLQDAGLEAGGVPELWNVERVPELEAIFVAYAEAGARYLTTNTFGASAPRLAMHGLDDRVHELNREGAALARRVADRFVILVGGDVGPTGELIFPLGALSPEDAQAAFAEQVRGLVEGGADFILIETMSDLSEIEAAVAAVREVAPGVEVAATMSFDTNGRTMMGVTPAAAAGRLGGLGVRVVGGNCGRGPADMERVVVEMTSAGADVFVMAQSNAGLPHLVGDAFEYDATPELMAAHAARLRTLGARVIGACCGSTPAHIAAMRAALAA